MAFPVRDAEVVIGPLFEPTTPPEKDKARILHHPKVSVMVNNALDELNDSKGSSLQAIKKYLGTKYEIDVEKLNLRIKKYLKSSVDEGSVIQVSGKGAAGSFKLKKKSRSDGKSVNPSKPKDAKRDEKPVSPNSATTSKKKLHTGKNKPIKIKKDNESVKESKNEKIKKPKPNKVTKLKTDTQPKVTKDSKEQKPKTAPQKKAKPSSKVSDETAKPKTTPKKKPKNKASEDVSDDKAKPKTKAKPKNKASEEVSSDTVKPKTSKKPH